MTVWKRGEDATMPDSNPWLATRPITDADEQITSAERLLLERARLGLRLILVGIVVVLIGWIVVSRGEQPRITIVQGFNFVAVAVALWVLNDPARGTFNRVAGGAAYAVTIVCTAAVGILAGDATTPIAILIGMAVIAGTMLPWSPWLQLLVVLLTSAACVWTVVSVVPSPPLGWFRSAGAIAPTLVSTIYVSDVLGRQRAAVAHAEHDRRAREAGLREANRRLEQEIQEHHRTEETLRFAMRELDHRVKHTFAVVQSVAEQTLRSAANMDEFGEAFSDRIRSMASIHNALAQRRWDGLALTDLVDLVVGPYRHHHGSISIGGDGIFVAAELVRVLGMTLHELATNSAKYGALSTAQGQVTITSQVDGAARLQISWSERGGPTVSEPTRRGFGMRLIEEALAYEADGRVALWFSGDGLCCDIEIPVSA